MTKKITFNRLYNIALYYLSRYDASSDKVRQMLLRRLTKLKNLKEDIPEQSEQWIEDVIVRLQELGYVNDERYIENQVRILSAAGKSKQFILSKLSQAGLKKEHIRACLEKNDINDLSNARRYVYKKKMGYLRPQKNRADFHQKDLATLARAGFSYEIAKQALSNPSEDE